MRGWIAQGAVKSAHDCSEGGLAVTLAESCISQQVARDTPRLIGAEVDLTATLGKDSPVLRLDAQLFGETQSRIVISTSAHNASKILGQAKVLGIPAMNVGKVGGAQLKIRTGHGEYAWNLTELHELWFHSIARAMK